MSRSRIFGSRSRQRSMSARRRGGVAAGSALQLDVLPQHRGETSEISSPSNSAPPRQHLVEHDAERPDVGAAIDGSALRLLGRHVGGGAEDHPHLRRARGERRRVHRVRRRASAFGPSALARPKSRTFTVPSARTLIFAGLRSRWMMPLLVRRFERLGDLARDGQGVGERQSPAFLGCRLGPHPHSLGLRALRPALRPGPQALRNRTPTGPRPRPVPSRGR